MREENEFIKKRLQINYQENEQLRSKILVLEQISADTKMNEHKLQIGYEEQIADLNERIERKE